MKTAKFSVKSIMHDLRYKDGYDSDDATRDIMNLFNQEEPIQPVKSLQEEIEKEAEKYGTKQWSDDELKMTASVECSVLKEDAIKDFIAGATWMSQFQRQEARGWVKVSDRLPEEHTDVLVYNGFTKSIHIGANMKGVFYRNGNVLGNITHWRKLPSPPETK